MAKLDEITELLTEELEGFNRSITKLERISSKMGNIKIQADSRIIEGKLDNYMYREEFLIKFYKKQIEEINRKLKWGKLLLILFCLVSMATILTMGYFGYQIIHFDAEREKVHNEGKKEIILQLRGYFDEYPDAYMNYEKWRNEQMETLD